MRKLFTLKNTRSGARRGRDLLNRDANERGQVRVEETKGREGPVGKKPGAYGERLSSEFRTKRRSESVRIKWPVRVRPCFAGIYILMGSNSNGRIQRRGGLSRSFYSFSRFDV